ncbi:MAG TPA: flagellar basal body P-ring formation chaperone FlgA [Bryobacteraceae bacterium]|nr:flagellar basal body P-ring formation chaperone FlgA [Bryobacteraceae bacterium]
MIAPIVWLLAAVAPAASCVTIAGGRIVAGDMARVAPAFAALPAATELGFAPAPGTRRTYGSAELARLARRYGLELEPGAEACFFRPQEILTAARVAAALARAMPTAHLELLDFSRQPVPPGELQFAPASGGGSLQTWRGAVSQPGRADFPVWAKLRVEVTGQRVVAGEPLTPGQPIARGQLRLEAWTGPPPLPDISEILGRAPRRFIAPGTPIQTQWLEDPAEIRNGDLVEVEVRSGQTRLLLEGRAQAAGKRGQVIPVRNPGNGKVFSAVVRARGRVLLWAGQAYGTAPGELP